MYCITLSIQLHCTVQYVIYHKSVYALIAESLSTLQAADTSQTLVYISLYIKSSTKINETKTLPYRLFTRHQYVHQTAK